MHKNRTTIGFRLKSRSRGVSSTGGEKGSCITENKWRHDRTFSGKISVQAFALLLVLAFAPCQAQDSEKSSTLPEQVIHPNISLCVLDPRGKTAVYPFDTDHFRNDLLTQLRSSEFITVKSEAEVKESLTRKRITVPDFYDPQALTEICRQAECDYVVFLRLVDFEMDLKDGFTIPVLFHRNKATYRIELDLAVVSGETGDLKFSKKIFGQESFGRGTQVFPITEDPAVYLDFRQKERLALRAMQNLAHDTYKVLIENVKPKPLGEKYICYWDGELHIISDHDGVCPVCGSRLIKKMVWANNLSWKK